MARKKTHEEYLQELKAKGIKVVPLEEYKNGTTKIKHKCVCGNVWIVGPHEVLINKKCGCARGLKQTKTDKEYKQQLKEKGIKITPFESYINDHTKIKHKCECGNVWEVTPRNVLSGGKCGFKNHSENRKMSHTNYLKQLKEKQINIRPLEKCKGYNEPILHRCECGNEWLASPSQIVRNGKCKCMQKSVMATKIYNFLNRKQINFVEEYSFKGFYEHKNAPYRYDFVILDGQRILVLIEYHGAQHFEFSQHWHKTKKYFLKCQKRDQIKRDYAKAKGIPLIEITYKEKDPIQALEKELKALGIMEPQNRKYEQLSLF